jgi:arabinofuranosyltransferase
MPFAKRFGIFFLLLLAITIADFIYLGKPSKGIDDANIFFRYAENIVHGYGFVFNPGGERVEGFTSFLWVLICAAFYAVSNHFAILLLGFSLFLTTLTITMVYSELEKEIEIFDLFFFKKYFFWIYCAFIICIGPSFVAWSVLSLMENGLWNFIFVSMVVMIIQLVRNDFSFLKKTIFIIAAILLLATRPEAFAWIIFFGLVFFIIQKVKQRSALFPIAFVFISVLVSIAATYFRKKYFGYPLPNTYYAKVSHNLFYNFSNGFKYGVEFLTTYNPVITISFVLLVAAVFNKKNLVQAFKNSSARYGAILHSLCIITVTICFSILLPFTTGGDHFGGFRFYQGIIPLFAWGLPAAFWLHDQSKEKTNLNQFAMSMTVVLFFALAGTNSLFNLKTIPNTQLNYEFYLAKLGRETANELNETWTDQAPSVGMVAVGGFALNYKGQTIDLMGLNNTLMGHSKGDRIGIKNHAAFNKDVFYQLHPDILLPKKLMKPSDALLTYSEYLLPGNFENQVMKNIFNDSLFMQSYHPVIIQKNGRQLSFFAFVNSNFLINAKQDTNVHYTVIKR